MIRTLPLLVVLALVAQVAAAHEESNLRGDPVPKLCKDLKSPSATTRRLAAEKLGKMKAVEAIDDLVAALQDEEKIVRSNAADSLVRIGAPAVPAVAKQLIQGKEEQRYIAVILLERMGPAAQKAIPELILALKDKNVLVRSPAAFVLGRLGPAATSAVPALIELATDSLKPDQQQGAIYQHKFAVEAIQKIDPKSMKKVAAAVLPRLIDGLRSAKHQLPSIQTLEWLGADAEPAIPTLKDAIFWKDLIHRESVFRTLANMGEKGEAVLLDLLQKPALGSSLRTSILDLGLNVKTWSKDKVIEAVAGLLKDEDIGIRHAAAEWLRIRGTGVPVPTAALLEALHDKKLAQYSLYQKGSFAVAEALAYGGEPSLPGLIKALQDGETLIQWQAAHGLATLGRKAKKAVAALQKNLDAKDDLVRLESAHALLRTGMDSPIALDVIRKSLQHASPLLREQGIHVVFALGRKGKALIPQLISLLDDPKLSQKAQNALRLLGTEASPAVPQLLKHIEKAKGFSRVGLLQVLEAIGPGAKEAVPFMIELLSEKNEDTRLSALMVLARIGTDATPATPSLIKLLQEENNPSFGNVITALGGIGPGAKAAVPALITMLDDSAGEKAATKKYWYRRDTIARALGQIGPDAAKAVPNLKSLLHDEDFNVRAWAAFAVARITKDNKAQVDFLAELYRDSCVIGKSMWSENDLPPTVAIEALAMLGPDIESAIPTLVDALHDPREELSITLSAIRALGNLGPKAKSTVPHLVQMLKDQHGSCRAAAAEALGAIGPDARDVIAALLSAEDDNEHRVAEAATDALQMIRGKLE